MFESEDDAEIARQEARLVAIRAQGTPVVPTHELQGDGLCNYWCTCGSWRYPHVGWGEPDEVATSQWHNEHVYWRNDGV